MRLAMRVCCALFAFTSVLAAHASTVQVTIGTSPSGVAFTVDGTQYSSTQTFTWTVGGSHTLSVTSPQTSNTTTEYTFSSWSDSGAISHTVTASASTTSYTASFTTSYELDTAVNSSKGTVTPASGNFYAAGSVVSIKASSSSLVFNDWTGSTDIADTSDAYTTITMNGPESITANWKKGSSIQYFAPVYVVTTATDDSVGVSANCPFGGPFNGTGLNCTLRDALEAASEAGAANINFDATAFASTNTAAQNTVTLSGGPLYLPKSTIINGPTVLDGTTRSNLVTINGGGQSTVFWISSGVLLAQINNLNIVNGSNGFGGAGIYTDGALTIWNSTISGNSSPGGQGGGIYVDVDGALTLQYSTLSGNSADTGAGMAVYGELIASEDTFYGNTATTLAGGIYDSGVALVSNCTVTGNTAAGTGGGIDVSVGQTLKLTNSIVTNNDSGAPLPDLQGTYTDGGGNEIAIGPAGLAPFGNYGGPTQTVIPLPSSPAICAGLQANVSPIVFSDQRGLPNMNSTYPGYSVSSPCIDSGAVQTNYSLAFSAQPTPPEGASSILMNTPFSAAVTLSESGSAFATPVSIPLALTGTGSLSGSTATTASGVATFSSLEISGAGTGDVLSASLALNPPLSPFPITLATASNAFDVVSLATVTTASSASTSFSASAQSIALSATVTTSSETVNAGTVTFTLLGGSKVVGSPVTSAALTSGTASANYILPAGTAPGTYTVQAVYNAAGGFTTSSDTSHTVTVSQAASSTALTSSTGNANLNANITFTAIVTGTAATVPTGSVTFMDGAKALGSGTLDAQGSATYSTSSLSAGTHVITAVYSGDADFAASTSAQYGQTVTAPSYTLSANPTSLSITAGQTGSATFTLTPVGGFSGTVSFACSDLPSHVVCGFVPSSITADGSNTVQSTTLTIGTSATSNASIATTTTAAGFAVLPCMFCVLLIMRRRKDLRRAVPWLALAIAAIGFTALAGCGGGSSRAPAGSYTVVITATPGSGASDGAAPQSVSFALTITD